MQMDLARYTIKKDYINHYVVKEGYVPLWVLVNAISFSRLSTFYNLMKQKERIEQSAQGILDARALYPDSSLADLYDPLTMPVELRGYIIQNVKNKFLIQIIIVY